MDCYICNEKIYLYHYDVLDDVETREVKQHIENCQNCQNLLKKSQKAIQLLEEWNVDSTGCELVHKVVEQIPWIVKLKPSNPLMILRWAGIAAVLLLALGLFWAHPRRESKTVVSQESNKKSDSNSPSAIATQNKTVSLESKTSSKTADVTKDAEKTELDRAVTDTQAPTPQNSPIYERHMAKRIPEVPKKEEDQKRPMTVWKEKENEQIKHDHTIVMETPIFAPEMKERVENEINKSQYLATHGNVETDFIKTEEHPCATFPIFLDTASYVNCKNFIARGMVPPKEEVCPEQFINYFSYDYPQPKEETIFSLTTEMGICPWNTSRFLLHIGLQGKNQAPDQEQPSMSIAKNVEGKIEFNTNYITHYRLIGCETQMIYPTQATDALKPGDVNAGHKVTVLYEIIPKNFHKNLASRMSPTSLSKGKNQKGMDTSMTIRVFYKTPAAEQTQCITSRLTSSDITSRRSSENLDWSAAVAGFAMALRHSKHKGNVNYDLVLELAEGARGLDADGHRSEFIYLVKRARTLVEK